MRLLDAKQVAAILQVSVQRVYELTRQGILPNIRIGARQIRFDEERLLRWIENSGRPGAIGLEDPESDNNNVGASAKQKMATKHRRNAQTLGIKEDRRGSALLLDELLGSGSVHFTLECVLRIRNADQDHEE